MFSAAADRFRRTSEGFLARIEAVPPDRWTAPTDERLDQEVVAHVFELLEPLDELFRQPWAFGPKVQPPRGADLQTEFLCFVGRRP